ncbi:MAG: flagellar basal body protein [Rhodomicrobium sp.]
MIANDIFDLAAHQASWLLARQRLVAQNVANANTPGYKAADLKPFEATMQSQSASLQLVSTSPRHFVTDISEAEAAAAADDPDNAEITYSGNDVSQEQQMGKAGAISRAYALNTSIVKAFNGMILQAAKG